MQWQDRGVVIGVRRFGETSVILELLTAEHGRHLGVVRGGRSRRLRAVLQPGNEIVATWRARLDDHIGSYVVEPALLRAGSLMESALALHALNHLCALAHLLAERDANPALFLALSELLDALANPHLSPAGIVRFELTLLADLGFGLDLETCAATGERTDLAYVSPKSGRAVSRTAGEPYRDKVFPLPRFLVGAPSPSMTPDAHDLFAGFRITGHFLARDVFAPRGLPLPDARRAYLAALSTVDLSTHTGRSAVRVTP